MRTHPPSALRPRRILAGSIAALIATAAVENTTQAVNGTWTNLAGGSWPVTTNWAGGTVADGLDGIADFSTLNITANATVTLDGARTIGTLRFQDITTASNDWILNTGTAGPLTLDVTAGLASIQVLNRVATINVPLAGADGIAATGAGVLGLGGQNTFTGQLTIGPGHTVQTNVPATGAPITSSPLGASGVGNETIVLGGGTLNVNAQNLGNGEEVRIAGTGVGGIGALVNNGAGQNNALSTVVLTANATIGGSGRFDIRNGTPLLNLAGFRMTKIGGNQFSVVGGSISEGMIDVNAGTLSIEANTAVRGNGTITINAAGVLGLWANLAGAQTRPLVLNGGTIRELGNTNVAEGPNLSFPVLLTATSTVDTGTAANDVQTSFLNDINESGGSFGITKNGTRTMRIGRAANISGPLTVNAGPVALNAGATLGTRLITLASGASFDASAVGGFTLPSGGTLTVGRAGAAANDVLGAFTTSTGSTINLNAGNTNHTATFANGLTIDSTNFNFDIGAAATDQVAVTGNLNATGRNPITLRAYGVSGIVPGNYSLFTYTTGGAPAAGNFVLTNASNFRQSITLVDPATTPNAVQVAVTGSNANLVWAGDGAANLWNINSATTWQNGATPDRFFELDTVTFDGTGAANPTVNLTTTVTPASVTASAPNDYTIGGAGKITGGTGITKSGAGALTLANFTHDFIGALSVTGGKIVGAYLPGGGVASSFGAGSAINLDGGGIEVNGASQGTNRTFTLGAGNGTIAVTQPLATVNLTTAVGGPGGLIKEGPGVLRLDANVAFTGNITVNAGVLRPNAVATLQTKTINVTSGATFDPNGLTGAAAPRPLLVISGDGVPGQAAIWNNGGAITNNPLYSSITLAGDASIGTNVRYDLNGGAGGLTFNGGAFALKKVGWGETWWAPNAGATVGNVIVEAGRFGVQSSGLLGDVTSSLIVNPGGELSSFGVVTNDKPILLNGGNFGNNNDATTATWTGGLTVNAPSFIGGNANVATRIIQLNNPTFSLSGTTLNKLHRNVLNVQGAATGTGPGDFNVFAGTVNFSAGSVIDGAGVLAIKSDGFVNLDDTGGAVILSKNTRLDGGVLASLNGSRTIGNLIVGGNGRVANGTAGTTLTIPSLTVPTVGGGITFTITGDIVVTNLNGSPISTGRLGPGYTAGTAGGNLLPAQWDGTRIATVAPTNTNFAPPPTPTDIVQVSAASTITTDTTVDTLVADATLNVNSGALLRLNGGALIMRGAANLQLTTSTAPRGSIASGRADGELHVTEGISFGTVGGDSGIRITIADNPLTGGAFRPVTLVKQGPGSLTDLGFDGTNGFNNTYTGGTIVNNGRIPFQSTGALGTGLVTIRDGGQVAWFNSTGARGNFLANNFSATGLGAAESGGLLGAIRFGIASQTHGVIGGNVTISGGTTRLHNQNTNDGIIAGVISGPAGATLQKTAANGVVLSNLANTYLGRTEIGSRDQTGAGALIVHKLANGGLPSSIGASSNAAANLLVQANGTLRYIGAGDSTDRLFTLGSSFGFNAIPTTTIEALGYGSLNFTNPGNLAITAGSYRTLVLSAPASTLGIYLNSGFRDHTFAPVLGNPTQGFGQLTKTGVGRWILTTDQAYSGVTTVTDGALQLGNGGTTGNVSSNVVTLQNNGDLVINRSNSLTLSQPINGVAANSTEVVQAGTGTTTLAGVIDNSSLRVRVESGTLVLGKTSTPIVHSAAIAAIVNGGTLQLGGSGDDQIFDGTAAGAATATVFMNGGVFDTNGRSEGLSRIEGTGGMVTNSAAGTSTLTLGTGNASSLVGVGTVLQNGAGTLALAKTGTGTIAITGNSNTFTGGTTVNQGTLSIGNGGATGVLGSPIVVNAGGTLAINRSDAYILTHAVSGTGDLAQIGTGTTTITSAQNYLGTTLVGNGVLNVDLTAANDVLPTAAQLRLNGGAVNFIGGPAGGSSQTIGGQFIVAGGDVRVNGTAGATALILPGAWTRTTGGSVNFATSGATSLNTTIPNVNGIIGTATAAYATLNGTSWATQSGGNAIASFAGYTPNTYAAGTHTDVTADFAFAGPTTTSTLRFNSPSAINLDLDTQTLEVSQGGILVTSTVGPLNPTSISNGTLTGAAAAGSELIVHQHNSASPMLISAVVADNGANPTTLTKAGGGTLILAAANTYTGGTHVNQGILQVGDGATAGSLGQGIVLNDATLLFNRSDNVTVLNPIGGYGNITKTGAGVLNLRGTNTFTGGVVVSRGTVAAEGPLGLGLGTITIGDAGTGSNNVALLSDFGGDISNNIVVSSAGTGTASIGSSSSAAVADPAIYSGAVTLNRNTIFQGSNTDRTTFTGVIDGTANLSFTSGRTTFENNNTFVGDVTVEAGANLQVGTGSFANIRNQIPDASTVTLNGNGFFTLNGDSEVIAQLNSTSDTSQVQAAGSGPTVLTVTNGGNFAGIVNGANNGGMTLESMGGTLTLSGTGDNNTGRVLVNGGTVILAKTSTAGVHAVAVDATVNSGTLQLGGTGGDQIWDGDATNRTQLVINGGQFDLNGRNEGFSILNGFGGTVTNTAAATTSTLTLGTSNWSNTGFFGSIQDGPGGGVLALVKTGAGGLIFVGTNTYSGGTTISATAPVQAGVLQLGNGGPGGTIGSGPVTNNGTLVFNRSDDFTFANVVSGPGRLVQNGSGTTTVSGPNTYTGSTTVNAGALLVTGSIGGSAVTVGGGTLGGTGSAGALSVDNGGTLAPGTGIGTLSTGPLSLFDGAILSLEIGATTADQVDVMGGALLDGNVLLAITLIADPVDSTAFSVINSTAGVSGYATGARFVHGGNSLDEGEQFTVVSAPFTQQFEIRYAADAGNDVVLLAVPEPTSATLLLASLGMAAGLQRFRRRRDA